MSVPIGLVSTLLLLCASPVVVGFMWRRCGVQGEVSFLHVVGTRVSCVHPQVLAVYRLFTSVYMVIIAVRDILRVPDKVYYFTYWCFLLLACYFAVVGAASLVWRWLVPPTVMHSRQWSKLAGVCGALCSTVFASALMVDLLLWSVLYPTEDEEGQRNYRRFSSINTHLLNFVLILLDVGVNSLPAEARDICPTIIVAAIYVMFTILRIACTPGMRHCLTEKCPHRLPDDRLVWPYFFLDTSSVMAPFWYTGLFVMTCVFYQITFFIRRRWDICFPQQSAFADGTPSTSMAVHISAA